MKTPIRRCQLRGLMPHHRHHPADHPRRLVNRRVGSKEPPENGICRWCYERTAHIRTRWYPYCLNAYRVASGQHPAEIQHPLCEMCGDPSDEMDHRLAINVARVLRPADMLRAVTPDKLRWLCRMRWLCRSCHRRKTRQDRRFAKFWRHAHSTGTLRSAAQSEQHVAAVVYAARVASCLPAADKHELMSAYRHEAFGNSGLRRTSATIYRWTCCIILGGLALSKRVNLHGCQLLGT